MKFMLIKSMMLISSIIPILNNPMSLGFMLIMQTMIMIMFMNKIMQSSWFIMITFLMMIGGLLILFTYMSSIASNEKFKIKINMIMLMILIMVISDEMMAETQIKELMKLEDQNLMEFSLMKIYNSKSMNLTILLVLYLLLTMISVTKIVKQFKGPLRNMN